MASAFYQPVNPVDDMQIAEDLQPIVGHICMQELCANPVGAGTRSVEAAE
jgi:hypothetical protein